MEKRILIPTDFQVESLNTLKLALSQNSDVKIRAMLMHGLYLDQSISDLLFYSEHNLRKKYMSDSFRESLDILNNSFERQLVACQILFFHGYNLTAFNRFLSAHQIDEIFLPKRYQFKLSDASFDTQHLIKKAGLPVTEVDWPDAGAEGNQLSNLFIA